MKITKSKPLTDYFELFRYRPLLIWGPQGSGKSTIARALVRLKRQQGQAVCVLNPHGSPVEWDGAEVVGQGRDYGRINGFLRSYLGEITERYKSFAKSGITEQQFLEQLVANQKVLSPVCEEMSGWFHNLNKNLLASFSLAALSESRKVAMAPVFIAHDRTLDFIGLKRGANLKDSGLVELELLAPETHPETGLLISSGRGILRIPGGAAFEVHFENFDESREPQPEVAPDSNNVFSAPVEDAAEPQSPAIDEKAAMVTEYLALQPECSSCSAVLDKLGTKLERRGLIERRTVDCLKAWLAENNLPLPSKAATPSEAETEPEPAPPPRSRQRTA
jgi:energy-coupling factor transporter ATP-binding protein EcfA2